MPDSLRFDTRKVHDGHDPLRHNHASAIPIYQTASFELGDTARIERLYGGEELGWLYSRVGNPTVSAFETRLASLEGATGAVAFGSGMAALTATLLALGENGGRILATPRLYGGTFDALRSFLPRYGVTVDFVRDPDDPGSFDRAIRPETRALFVESVSNPDAHLADIPALAAVAHRAGLPLVVDNTLATPYLLRPLELGADIVIHSATKGIGGQGLALGGIVLEKGGFAWQPERAPGLHEPQRILRERASGRPRSFLESAPDTSFTLRLRLEHLAYLGAVLGPFEAFLLANGLATLSERVSKQVATAERLVLHLSNHPKVAWAKHPSLPGSPDAAIARRDFPRGAGSVFSFGLTDSDANERFLDTLELFSLQANLGDARSLILDSPRTVHGELTEEELALSGILPGTLRVSVGLEDPEDLIADLERSLDGI